MFQEHRHHLRFEMKMFLIQLIIFQRQIVLFGEQIRQHHLHPVYLIVMVYAHLILQPQRHRLNHLQEFILLFGIM
ncbi:MAG: hypothetical protein EBT17_05940 [Actinobacteria bacterium]|nr:hypothetical protein [Actinomycetota bacterium]